LKEAQRTFGNRNAWTFKGNIFVAVDGEKNLIRTEEDIDILAENGSKSDIETDDVNSN